MIIPNGIRRSGGRFRMHGDAWKQHGRTKAPQSNNGPTYGIACRECGAAAIFTFASRNFNSFRCRCGASFDIKKTPAGSGAEAFIT